MTAREGPDPNCILWEWGTYKRTLRLIAITTGAESPNEYEIKALWDMYVEGTQDALGDEATYNLREFFEWCFGEGDFEGIEPAEVVW